MYTVVVADDEEELRRAIVRRIDWESTGFRVVGEAERCGGFGTGGKNGAGSSFDGYKNAVYIGY